MALRWYVVHAYSGYEKKVAQKLEEEVKRLGMDDLFGRIVVPTEEVMEVKEGKKITSERKFFPGYVFVQMEMNDKTWHMVRHLPQVLGFIGGTSDRPAPITDREMQKILDRMEDVHENPRPKVIFEPGEMVHVIDGPFTDFEAVVESVDYENSKLQVSVLIFGRSTPVELEFSQVQKS